MKPDFEPDPIRRYPVAHVRSPDYSAGYSAGRASRDEEVRELLAGAKQLLITLRKDDYRMTASEIAMTAALAKFK